MRASSPGSRRSTMHRRAALRTIAGAATAGPLLRLSADESSNRPNILFVMTDDQRHDAMGVAGNPILRTPNMDRIAAEGVRFTQAFVTNSLCGPSRASVLTGLYS